MGVLTPASPSDLPSLGEQVRARSSHDWQDVYARRLKWKAAVLGGLGRLAVRAEAADQESLRRIQDLLTARLTVAWQDLGG